MANILNFPFDGVKTLALNVENVYRVDNDGSNLDEMRFFNNIASAAGTEVWTTTVKFTTNITEAQQKTIEKAVRDVQQTPQGVIEVSSRDDSLILHATTPFAVAGETQP